VHREPGQAAAPVPSTLAIPLLTAHIPPPSPLQDPSTFQPVCPASDGLYRFGQTLVVAVVGPENYKEYAPLIAGGLLRVRLELCVVESFAYEAVIPFVQEKGLSWILPLHETVETFLAGVIFAIASNFILIGSTKIVTVIATYADVFVGLPIRLVGAPAAWGVEMGDEMALHAWGARTSRRSHAPTERALPAFASNPVRPLAHCPSTPPSPHRAIRTPAPARPPAGGIGWRALEDNVAQPVVEQADRPQGVWALFNKPPPRVVPPLEKVWKANSDNPASVFGIFGFGKGRHARGWIGSVWGGGGDRGRIGDVQRLVLLTSAVPRPSLGETPAALNPRSAPQLSSSPCPHEGMLRAVGEVSGGIRRAVEAVDFFVGRYLLLSTVAYVGFKFVHYKIFDPFPL